MHVTDHDGAHQMPAPEVLSATSSMCRCAFTASASQSMRLTNQV